MAGTGTAPRRPRGRPPRIDRDAIADAVLELGIDGVSMKAVADHLGVSVAGLYHHVRGRRELLLLAAERSMAAQRPPEDRGQHWSEWLREWARYSRQAFVDEPEVFTQYLQGAVSVERTAEVVDSVVRVLGTHGFDPAAALAAWEAVGDLAVGSAVAHLRAQAGAGRGHPQAVELERILAELPPDTLPGMRAALGASATGLEDLFEEELTALLVGIAVRRGEPWQRLLAREA